MCIRDRFVFGMPVALERPASRGRLSLTSADPHIPPKIELNYVAEPDDLRKLMDGLRLAWRVAHEPEIAQHIERISLLTDATLQSDDLLADYVRMTVSTQFHPCGTAKMGPADDPMAVVDQHCRVHGVENLSVVDASVMPCLLYTSDAA